MALFAALIVGAFWPMPVAPDYSGKLKEFWGEIAAALDANRPGLSSEIDSFQAVCSERIRAGKSDRAAASAAYPIVECLGSLSRERDSLRGEWVAAQDQVAALLERAGGNREAAGREYELAKQAGDAIQTRWAARVNQARAECLAGVAELQKAMKGRSAQALTPNEKGTVPLWRWALASLTAVREEYLPGGFSSLFGAAPEPEEVRTICTVCNGAASVTCSVCGGRGSVQGISEKDCDQCKGTGTYSFRTSRRGSACPFCKGVGKIRESVMQPCTACEAKGVVPCQACEGKGYTISSAAK